VNYRPFSGSISLGGHSSNHPCGLAVLRPGLTLLALVTSVTGSDPRAGSKERGDPRDSQEETHCSKRMTREAG
jgi:hypothetical protein